MQVVRQGGTTRISSSRSAGWIGVIGATVCLAASAPTPEPLQATFAYDALNDRMPVVRQQAYVVNARIRPLLFWIGRDNIGDARLAWREASGGRRGFELLIGSDPDRAPRRINRWGFIVEELSPMQAQVLGLMKESNEQTIDEAEAQISRQADVSVFKALRTTIIGNHAVTETMTVPAPARLTYRDLDSLLALIPVEARTTHTVELPSGTQIGFLVAMDSLIHASIGPCHSRTRDGAHGVAAIPFVYGKTLYDLSLVSCTYAPSLRTRTGIFARVVEGRFQVRNRTTKDETRFGVSYGASGARLGLPVRAVFRPRWWIEIELLLEPFGGSATTSLDEE